MFNSNLNGNVNHNPRKRLIVLVPGGLIETAKFARQIRWLALQQQRDVVFLALSARDDYMGAVRLLATVEAITRDGMFTIETREVETGNWIKAIRTVYQQGDLIVCHEGQKVAAGPWKKIPLDEHLSRDLHLPASVLPGFYQGEAFMVKPMLKGLLFWMGSFLIVLGFSLVEYRVDHLMAGTMRVLVMSILLVFASGLIYQLNKFTG